MSDPTDKSPRPKRRIRLAALFAAATMGMGGVAYHITTPPHPYDTPTSVSSYAIPDVTCAKVLLTAAPTIARGDGRPVLLIPGFMSGDSYLSEFSTIFAAQGYKPHGWQQGANLGIDADGAAVLVQRLKDISVQNGGQKVALIGHSLGGIYARELARKHPELVSHVITLGSPFNLRDADGVADARIASVYKAFHGADSAVDLLTPPPVPTTSLYSLHDRIVMWPASLNPKDAPRAENIPVTPGHLGMAKDPAVAQMILHRLAETPATWQPAAQRLCPSPAP